MFEFILFSRSISLAQIFCLFVFVCTILSVKWNVSNVFTNRIYLLLFYFFALFFGEEHNLHFQANASNFSSTLTLSSHLNIYYETHSTRVVSKEFYIVRLEVHFGISSLPVLAKYIHVLFDSQLFHIHIYAWKFAPCILSSI